MFCKSLTPLLIAALLVGSAAIAPLHPLEEMPPSLSSNYVADGFNIDAKLFGQLFSAGKPWRRGGMPAIKFSKKTSPSDFNDVFVCELGVNGPFATSMAVFVEGIKNILSNSAWNKMLWINAQAIVASVHNHFPMWNRPIGQDVGYSVRTEFTIPIETSVSQLARRAEPQPAFTTSPLPDLAPKSIGYGKTGARLASSKTIPTRPAAKSASSLQNHVSINGERGFAHLASPINSSQSFGPGHDGLRVNGKTHTEVAYMKTDSEAIESNGEKDPDPPAPTPSLTLPAKKSVKVGRTFYLVPKTNCTSLKWIVPDGLEQDTEIMLKDKNAIALASDTAGVYKVMAFGVLNNTLADPATCVVTVGEPPPPGPTPPGPNPPGPVDPLTQALQAAYTQDTDADKAKYVKTLGTLYETAATSTVNDTNITTLGQLFQTMSTASGSLLPATAIPKTRAAIAAYLSAQVGTNAAQALDQPTRTKCVTAFSAVSAALGSVK